MSDARVIIQADIHQPDTPTPAEAHNTSNRTPNTLTPHDYGTETPAASPPKPAKSPAPITNPKKRKLDTSNTTPASPTFPASIVTFALYFCAAGPINTLNKVLTANKEVHPAITTHTHYSHHPQTFTTPNPLTTSTPARKTNRIIPAITQPSTTQPTATRATTTTPEQAKPENPISSQDTDTPSTHTQTQPETLPTPMESEELNNDNSDYYEVETDDDVNEITRSAPKRTKKLQHELQLLRRIMDVLERNLIDEARVRVACLKATKQQPWRLQDGKISEDELSELTKYNTMKQEIQ
ncbi:salivary glue protein Sgs-3-like [Haliotis cracherodii]|uniref:salivary glue protein Sgs-3-like n=1 Tax=Haliotis cracherodii TaxID=6455 RepID=UPI0039E760B0